MYLALVQTIADLLLLLIEMHFGAQAQANKMNI